MLGRLWNVWIKTLYWPRHKPQKNKLRKVLTGKSEGFWYKPLQQCRDREGNRPGRLQPVWVSFKNVAPHLRKWSSSYLTGLTDPRCLAMFSLKIVVFRICKQHLVLRDTEIMSLSAAVYDVVVVGDVTSVPHNHRDWMTRLFTVWNVPQNRPCSEKQKGLLFWNMIFTLFVKTLKDIFCALFTHKSASRPLFWKTKKEIWHFAKIFSKRWLSLSFPFSSYINSACIIKPTIH